jgi:hypothetical protein
VLFPSIPFLFYFLPLTPGIAAKNLFLLLASLLFYAWGSKYRGATLARDGGCGHAALDHRVLAPHRSTRATRCVRGTKRPIVNGCFPQLP